jgi:tRNA threonylcarbamoyl adenosine modification protein YeaZ
MKTLILETSTEKACLVLAEGGRPLSFKHLSGGPELSRRLALEVKCLLSTFKPDCIAVGTGPGSYTGIRVGAALAKGLSYGWQIPLVGFCGLAAFGSRVLVDARMGGLYAWIDSKALLLSLEDPRLREGPWSSPNPETIKKRLSFSLECSEASPDPKLLAQIAETGAPFSELCYLTSP